MQSHSSIQDSQYYYCPMHCEGEKTYRTKGHCPKCGMDLLASHPSEVESSEGRILLKKLWIAFACTLPIFMISMGELIPENPLFMLASRTTLNWLQFLLSLPVILYACRSFFEKAWTSLITWKLNMYTLIGMGTGIAFLFSISGLFFPQFFPDAFKNDYGIVHPYFETVTVILTLVLFGQFIEEKVQKKAHGALHALMQLVPSEVTLLQEGQDISVSIHAVQPGDLLRVKPGDKIPVDGIITEGESDIDESMITGEAIPSDKKKGDQVRSGTVNGNGAFVMRAEKVGSATLLAQIIKMVSEASHSRAPIQRIVDRIASYFVPAVMGVSLLSFLVWGISPHESALVYGFLSAIGVLIIACPCALGLATPMSITVGIGNAARRGVLIRNAGALEMMNKVDVLIIDKTGTITEGRPSVERVSMLQKDREATLLQYLVSLSRYSAHPLSRSIVKYGETMGIQFLELDGVKSITGKGLTGSDTHHHIVLGNSSLLKEAGISLDPGLKEQISREQSKGKTVSYFAFDGVLVGYVVISDAIKSTSDQALSQLRQHEINVSMMSGDHEDTVRAVAERLGIHDYQWSCLPEDKLDRVKKLQAEGHIVAVAGDGVNDAPALMQADVGIAMDTGSAAAVESADITLLHGDLIGILGAKNISLTVLQNIKQNLFFAFFYNILGIPIAAGALFPLFGLLLSPMLAAVAMSLSSISVILNALGLRLKASHSSSL